MEHLDQKCRWMHVERALATLIHSGEHCRHFQRVSFFLTLEPKHRCHDDDDDDDANGSDDGDNDAVICILMQEKK
jgi:hypothetical protein